MRPHPHAPALVTGAAAGIGRATALALAATGRPVYALDRDAEGLARLPGDAGIIRVVADVRDASARRGVVEEIERRHGPLGALVSNAGYGVYGPVETLDLDVLRDLMETNVLGGLALVQLALPGMREAGRGRIVAIGSVVADADVVLLSGYSMTKRATSALYSSLRPEVAQFGIDVVQIEPGQVDTGFADHTVGIDDPAVGGPPSAYRALTPAQRQRVVAVLRATAARPERVADDVVRAVTARRPRSLYRPGWAARIDSLAWRVAPTPVWDRGARLIARL